MRVVACILLSPVKLADGFCLAMRNYNLPSRAGPLSPQQRCQACMLGPVIDCVHWENFNHALSAGFRVCWFDEVWGFDVLR